MMKSKITFRLVIGTSFLLATVLFPGCKPAGPGESNSAGKPRVALIMKSLANEFFLTMENGAKAHQKAHAADYDLLANGIKDELDVSRQIDLVEQMVAQKVDAIVIAPADSKALVPVCKKAHAAGINVVNIDNKFDDAVLAASGAKFPFVGPNNRKGAQAVGDFLAQKLKRGDKRAVAGFIQDRINVNYIRRDRYRPSGVALIFVSEDGQNSIAISPGANARLSPADVRRARREFARADVLLMQRETPLPTVMAATTLAVRHGVPVILNPAPATELPDALLRQVSILTPNESEAELLAGVKLKNEATAARAADKLRSRGVQTVIITLGARGAFVAGDKTRGLIPGFKIKAVDTTAAGDIFNGALAVALTEGRALDQAVRFANAAAAISVMRLGAQPSAPARWEIERFLQGRD